MVRFLRYSGPKVCEIFHLPRPSRATLDFLEKKKKQKPEGLGKRPSPEKSKTL
jgi:hypothetical protein